MGPGVRFKLVLLSVAVLVVVSFGFTALSLSLTRGWIEDDLRERAIAFAREIAATIGDRRELESTALLHEQITQILGIRRNVGQLDILAFEGDGARVVATSHGDRRLPFTRHDVARVQQGQVVSRLIESPGERYWEVMAPITLAGVACRGRRGSLLARPRRPGRRPHPRLGLRAHRRLRARDGAPDEPRHLPGGGSAGAALRGSDRPHPDRGDDGDRAGDGPRRVRRHGAALQRDDGADQPVQR